MEAFRALQKEVEELSELVGDLEDRKCEAENILARFLRFGADDPVVSNWVAERRRGR